MTAEEDFDQTLAALVALDEKYLAAYPTLPLREHGVRYRRSTDETLCDVFTVIERGYGNEVDFTCWRVAELRQSGEDKAAKPMFVMQKLQSGTEWYTVYVVRGDGRTETWDGKVVDRP